MLVLGGNGEGLEEEDEDEEVVDGERLLQHVAGEELQALLPSVDDPDPEAEPEREGDPEEAPADRFAEPLSVSPPRGDAQIESEQEQHPGEEAAPERGRSDVLRARLDGGRDHARCPLLPRGVRPVFCRKTSRTGTCNWKRSRSPAVR